VVEDLAHYPTLSSLEQAGDEVWTLREASGARRVIRHQPRLTCGDLSVIKVAAIAGLGIALLPDHLVREEIESRRLVRVFDAWFSQSGIVHMVFTTRRGMPPAVRALIDHLVAVFEEGLIPDSHYRGAI
jgi:DNA-binding transcriptional LysR family regulator